MNYSALIPRDISHFLGGFTKEQYPRCFEDYLRGAREALETGAGPADFEARLLVSWMDTQVKGWFSKRKRMDQQLLLMEYTVPAALRLGRRPFALALQKAWNEAHPDFAFGIATYEEFYAEFNKTLLGFKIDREDKG